MFTQFDRTALRCVHKNTGKLSISPGKPQEKNFIPTSYPAKPSSRVISVCTKTCSRLQHTTHTRQRAMSTMHVAVSCILRGLRPVGAPLKAMVVSSMTSRCLTLAATKQSRASGYASTIQCLAATSSSFCHSSRARSDRWRFQLFCHPGPQIHPQH